WPTAWALSRSRSASANPSSRPRCFPRTAATWCRSRTRSDVARGLSLATRCRSSWRFAFSGRGPSRNLHTVKSQDEIGLDHAIQQALIGRDEGGVPIGGALIADDGTVLG